jgi:hypothetical protein
VNDTRDAAGSVAGSAAGPARLERLARAVLANAAASRERTPVGPALERAGWPLAPRDPVLAFASGAFLPPPPVPGLSLEPIDAGASEGLLEMFLGVQHCAFQRNHGR